jgi:hypothetical protein
VFHHVKKSVFSQEVLISIKTDLNEFDVQRKASQFEPVKDIFDLEIFDGCLTA